jgi:hypothetical protein
MSLELPDPVEAQVSPYLVSPYTDALSECPEQATRHNISGMKTLTTHVWAARTGGIAGSSELTTRSLGLLIRHPRQS